MSFKTILVHCDADRRASVRIDIAAEIAAQSGGHLVGLHAKQPVRLPGYVLAELGEDLINQHRRAADKQGDAVRATFEAAARRAGLGAAEWRSGEGEMLDLVTLSARYADLVVVGQHDPDDEASTIPGDFAELAAVQAGRPVLVVPYAGRFDKRIRRVVIAWNASRESTRAVTDAMPFLRAAEKVTVLVINPKNGMNGHGEVPGADLALWLSRHGVKAEATVDPGVTIDIGSYLLSRTADLEADMIVMGAYGHARMREIVFGGVTRTIMTEMTVPILLSH